MHFAPEKPSKRNFAWWQANAKYDDAAKQVADRQQAARIRQRTRLESAATASSLRPKGRARGWSTAQGPHGKPELAAIAVAMADPSPRSGVKTEDHEFKGERVLSSFLGALAVDWLLKYDYAGSRTNAIKVRSAPAIRKRIRIRNIIIYPAINQRRSPHAHP